MAVRNVFKLGESDDVLRKKSRPVMEIDGKTLLLIDDLKDTLHHVGGLGLAAPQVGILKRICIVDYEGELYEMINPTVAYVSQETLVDEEGCLSVSGYRGLVRRPAKVKIAYTDREGKNREVSAEGYKARCFLHELDHLDGILFVDKMIRKVAK